MKAFRTFAICVFLLIPACFRVAPAHAGAPPSEPDYGNLFKCAQHALAAEMRYQPPDALLEGARVLHTKGECFRGKGWLTAWDLAVWVVSTEPSHCIRVMACQGFFLYETVEPDRQELISEAVYQAMTEDPPIARNHWDGRDAPYAAWWFDPTACPNGFWFVGTLRFC